MMVRTVPFSNEPLFEGACPTCNGHGRTRTVSLTSNHEWEGVCDNCFGDTKIGPELRERIDEGEKLRRLMIEREFTMREASVKFGGSVTEWSDARRGKLTLADIQAKIRQIKGE
jgi:hypothetical protein